MNGGDGRADAARRVIIVNAYNCGPTDILDRLTAIYLVLPDLTPREIVAALRSNERQSVS